MQVFHLVWICIQGEPIQRILHRSQVFLGICSWKTNFDKDFIVLPFDNEILFLYAYICRSQNTTSLWYVVISLGRRVHLKLLTSLLMKENINLKFFSIYHFYSLNYLDKQVQYSNFILNEPSIWMNMFNTVVRY